LGALLAVVAVRAAAGACLAYDIPLPPVLVAATCQRAADTRRRRRANAAALLAAGTAADDNNGGESAAGAGAANPSGSGSGSGSSAGGVMTPDEVVADINEWIAAYHAAAARVGGDAAYTPGSGGGGGGEPHAARSAMAYRANMEAARAALASVAAGEREWGRTGRRDSAASSVLDGSVQLFGGGARTDGNDSRVSGGTASQPGRPSAARLAAADATAVAMRESRAALLADVAMRTGVDVNSAVLAPVISILAGAGARRWAATT